MPTTNPYLNPYKLPGNPGGPPSSVIGTTPNTNDYWIGDQTSGYTRNPSYITNFNLHGGDKYQSPPRPPGLPPNPSGHHYAFDPNTRSWRLYPNNSGGGLTAIGNKLENVVRKATYAPSNFLLKNNAVSWLPNTYLKAASSPLGTKLQEYAGYGALAYGGAGAFGALGAGGSAVNPAYVGAGEAAAGGGAAAAGGAAAGGGVGGGGSAAGGVSGGVGGAGVGGSTTAGGYATSPGWAESAITSTNIGAGSALGGGGINAWLGGNIGKTALLNTGVNLISAYFNNKAISDANAANQRAVAQRIRQALEQMDPAHIQALVQQYFPEIMALQNPAGQTAIQATRERSALSGRPIDDPFSQTLEAGLRGQLANSASSQAFQNAISTAQGNQSAITGTPIPQQQVVPGVGNAIQDSFNQLLAARYANQLRQQQQPYNYYPGSTVMYGRP